MARNHNASMEIKMDDRSVSNDSIEDFARFVSAGVVANYREEYSDFPKGADVEDVFAKALVDQYRREDGALSVPARSEVALSGDAPASSSSESVFPLDFDVNVVVGSLHGQVTNPSSGEYLLTATFKILGKTLDETEIRFKDGVLSRTEEVGALGQTVKTTFTIDVSDGFRLGIEGHVSNFLKDFDFGPYWLP